MRDLSRLKKHADKEKNKNSRKPFSLREWLFSIPDDRDIFWFGIAAAIVLVIVWIVYRNFFDGVVFKECAFKRVTGLYCPGCGGTRSVKALLSGHFIRSFIYHPFIPYCIIMWILYEGSHILEMLHVPHIKGMKFRSAYAWWGIGILLVNWIVKNIILIVINM